MRGRGWIGEILREGNRQEGKWVRVSYREEGERMAVVAGREVGGAVVRNRIRRRVREIWRRIGGSERMGGRVVVRVKRRAADVGYAALEKDLEEVLRRIERKR